MHAPCIYGDAVPSHFPLTSALSQTPTSTPLLSPAPLFSPSSTEVVEPYEPPCALMRRSTHASHSSQMGRKIWFGLGLGLGSGGRGRARLRLRLRLRLIGLRLGLGLANHLDEEVHDGEADPRDGPRDETQHLRVGMGVGSRWGWGQESRVGVAS